MKKSILTFALIAMMAIAPMAFAASVDGTIQADGEKPLKYVGYIQAFWFNEENGLFEEKGFAEVGPDQIDFVMDGLPEGNYYFVIGGKGYMTEYYDEADGTLNFDEKVVVYLLEDDAITLVPITLTRTPYQFVDTRLSVDEVPSGTSTIKVEAKVLNTTKKAQPLKIWFLVSSTGSTQFGSPATIFLAPETLSKPKNQTVKPNTYTNISFPLKVPFSAPDNRTYTVTLYGGFSEWEPSIEPTLVGTFTKGVEELKVKSSGLPKTVSKSGKVVELK